MGPADNVLRLPPSRHSCGPGLLHLYLALQSPVHPFSLCCVIVKLEDSAQQVPPQAFNLLLPGRPGRPVRYRGLAAGFTSMGTSSAPRAMSSPSGLPQPPLQSVDAVTVISAWREGPEDFRC